MSSDLAVIFSFSGCLLGLVIVLILIFVNRKLPFHNLLLALCIFSFTYLMFVSSLIWSGLIIRVPHFFRTASPVIYLIAPFAFLYVRAVLEEEKKFRLIDGLHFLPAFLHFLELVPFFAQSSETKLSILQAVFADPDYSLAMYEGILPANVHSYLKTAIGLIYFMYQFYLIRVYRQENKPLDPYQEKVTRWLNFFTLVLTTCYAALLLGMLIDNEASTVQHLLTVLVGAALLIILAYLFFQPQILYGLSDFSESDNLIDEVYLRNTETRNLSLSTDLINDYKQRIEDYLEIAKPFLNSDFRMQDMVEHTGIPRHYLSAVINTVYEKNFSRLINEYRINYIYKNKNNPAWSNLTLEGMGMEAGFKSRSTLLHAFRKETGMSPSEFLEKAS